MTFRNAQSIHTSGKMGELHPGKPASELQVSQEHATANRNPIIGLLESIRSLYNVGSIFRTSDGAMVQSLYLCGYTPRPPRREIDKTALGATKSVPWSYFKSAAEGIASARQLGATICVLERTPSSVPYFNVRKSDFPICLVLGNELTGVSGESLTAADFTIQIPMYGAKQSLNAAVAYGIAVFELVRIWKST